MWSRIRASHTGTAGNRSSSSLDRSRPAELLSRGCPAVPRAASSSSTALPGTPDLPALSTRSPARRRWSMQPKRDYEVGRGKPPKHSQFRKGQSGNPCGRPRGAKNFDTLLIKALDEKVVKPEWFPRYQPQQRPETFDRIVQSWDTANKVSQLSDYSVCTTWGVKENQVYLLHVFRRQLEFPDLKRAVRAQQAMYSANLVLIEDQASGTQ